MGRLHARLAALHAVVRRMDGQPLAAAGAGGDLRPLHFEVLLPLRVVPQRTPLPAEQDLQDRLRMGQRHHLRHGGGVAGAHLHLPDVRHPHLVDGKVAADRRLPLREQGDLRPADAQHAAVVPVRTPHDAFLADEKIVFRGGQVALPPAQGIAQDQTQRRGGLQFPGGRHRTARKPGRDLLRRAARLRRVVRQGGGTQAPRGEVHHRQPPGGQARELHQALRRHRGRFARSARRAGVGQRIAAGAVPRHPVPVCRTGHFAPDAICPRQPRHHRIHGQRLNVLHVPHGRGGRKGQGARQRALRAPLYLHAQHGRFPAVGGTALEPGQLRADLDSAEGRHGAAHGRKPASVPPHHRNLRRA